MPRSDKWHCTQRLISYMIKVINATVADAEMLFSRYKTPTGTELKSASHAVNNAKIKSVLF